MESNVGLFLTAMDPSYEMTKAQYDSGGRLCELN